MPDIDLVLPCLDEADALRWLLPRIPPGVRPLVVDNGSSDNSAEVARELGAEVVTCQRRGYGAACQAGLAVATSPLVAFCDCDATIDPAIVPAFAELAVTDDTLVVGQRRAVEKGVWPAHLNAGNRLIAWQLRRRAGTRLRDIGPLRVAPTESFRLLRVGQQGGGYPVETVLRAALAGWQVIPADLPYRRRIGESKVSGTLRGTAKAWVDMQSVLNS